VIFDSSFKLTVGVLHFLRLQEAGRVIESYHSSMDSFLTKPEDCVSISTIFLKQELLIDPHQRI
jgi:hypothetical protein